MQRCLAFNTLETHNVCQMGGGYNYMVCISDLHPDTIHLGEPISLKCL